MQKTQQFTAATERKDDMYAVLCPELDVASQRETVEMARENLKEAIELFFETASQQEIRDRMHDEVFVTRAEIAVGNLRILSGKEACHIFSQHGFQEERQGGSQVIMQEKIGNSITTIPVPNHKEVKPGRLKSINWQSKLPTKDFES